MDRVLVITGAAGFIGWRFSELAAARGKRLVLVDELDAFANRPEHAPVPGERVDRAALFDWLPLHAGAVEAIVHLGACTDTTERDEEKLARWNMEYSRRLWETAADADIPFVYASSAATYGDGRMGYSDDESRIPDLRPLNPYGRSKHRFDCFALDADRAGRRPPRWSGYKFFNVYGFGERHKGSMASVFLKAFDQIRKDGIVRLFESGREDIPHGEQKRDFVAVEDVANVLWFALDRGVPRGIYNLGSGEARSFRDLATITFAAMGLEPRIEYVPIPPGLGENYQYFTRADLTRLREIGYTEPFRTIEAGGTAYVQRLARSVAQ